MPNNTEFVDESKKLTDSPKKITEEGKKQSRLVKLTDKSKKALINAVNKRINSKKASHEDERAKLVSAYNKNFFDLESKLHEGETRSDKELTDAVGTTMAALETLNVKIIDLDKKIRKLNSRLVVEGKKVFNLKEVTFKKIVATIKKKREVNKLPERYLNTKDSIEQLVSDKKYHSAQKELTELYNYVNTLSTLSNSDKEPEIETAEPVVEPEIQKPSVDISNFDFAAFSKKKTETAEESKQGEQPVVVEPATFERIKKETEDGFNSILSEIENGIKKEETPVVSQPIKEEVKKVPIVTESAEPVKEPVQSQAYSKFVETLNNIPKPLSSIEMVEEKVKSLESQLAAARAEREALIEAENKRKMQINPEDIRAMMLEGKSNDEILKYYSELNPIQVAMAMGQVAATLTTEEGKKK